MCVYVSELKTFFNLLLHRLQNWGILQPNGILKFLNSTVIKILLFASHSATLKNHHQMQAIFHVHEQMVITRCWIQAIWKVVTHFPLGMLQQSSNTVRSMRKCSLLCKKTPGLNMLWHLKWALTFLMSNNTLLNWLWYHLPWDLPPRLQLERELPLFC